MTQNQPSTGLLPTVQPLIEFAPGTKDMVIGAIKKVLERLQTKDLVTLGVSYGDVLKRPNLLAEFIDAYKNNRGIGRDVAINAAGRAVEDDDAALICGMTLGQIERMLVFTCAKRVFAELEAIDGKNHPVPPEVRDYIAFDWQLPLLKVMGLSLSAEHFRVLGEGLLVVRSLDAVQSLGELDAAEIAKGRQAVGGRFLQVLGSRPMAFRGLALLEKGQLQVYEQILGPRLWEFLARDTQVILEVLKMDPERRRLMGVAIADVCMPTLTALERVNVSILAPFLETFREIFGERAESILAHANFADSFLYEIIERFREIGRGDLSEEKRESVRLAMVLKWRALDQKVTQWLAAGAPLIEKQIGM